MASTDATLGVPYPVLFAPQVPLPDGVAPVAYVLRPDQTVKGPLQMMPLPGAFGTQFLAEILTTPSDQEGSYFVTVQNPADTKIPSPIRVVFGKPDLGSQVAIDYTSPLVVKGFVRDQIARGFAQRDRAIIGWISKRELRGRVRDEERPGL